MATLSTLEADTELRKVQSWNRLHWWFCARSKQAWSKGVQLEHCINVAYAIPAHVLLATALLEWLTLSNPQALVSHHVLQLLPFALLLFAGV
jgi:hypothetical protein